MALRIQPFEASHADAVVAFNRRLAAGGQDWRFPESPKPTWLAREEGSPLFQELFLAVDGGAVRGGYVIQHRAVAVWGAEREMVNWYLPISEGLVDARFAMVAPLLLRDVLRRHPVNFVLGMNGLDSPLAQLAVKLGFQARVLPTFVRVQHGARVARGMRRLRRRRAVAFLLDAAAVSGVASLGAGLLRGALARGPRLPAGLRVETVPDFGPPADALWRRCRAEYSFVGVRDAVHLSRIYPAGRRGLERLQIWRDERLVGWAVLQVAKFSDNPNFGSLHVGRLTDCFGAPEDAPLIVRAAVDALAARGVDLMLSNQSHPAWCAALRASAFLSVPSNFAFGASPALAEQLRGADPGGTALHLNRGDGDGPWGHDPRAF